jgi:hypothetical protein
MTDSINEIAKAGRFVTKKLKDIKPHVRYDEYSEILTVIDYAMTVSNCMTPWALSSCFLMHPVVVLKAKGTKGKTAERYVSISGLRTLNLAKSILGSNAEVPVIYLEQYRNEIVELMVSADILFTHFLFSIKKPETLGNIFCKIPEEDIKLLLVAGAQSRFGFAQQTSYVYNSLFPQKAKANDELLD